MHGMRLILGITRLIFGQQTHARAVSLSLRLGNGWGISCRLSLRVSLRLRFLRLGWGGRWGDGRRCRAFRNGTGAQLCQCLLELGDNVIFTDRS